MAKKDSTSIKSALDSLNLWAMSGEIGLKLAIPLVIFMLVGIKLKSLNTTPLFMLIGIGLAAASSIYMIYRMITNLNVSEKSR